MSGNVAMCDAEPCPGPSDDPDARFTQGGVGAVGSVSGFSVPAAYDGSDTRYKMDHKKRGTFLIVNNKTFDKDTGMNDRSGTDVDAGGLYQLFKKFGFSVTLKHNQTCDQIKKLFEDAGKDDYSDSDCFGAAVLSHGDDAVIYGVDGVMPLETIIRPIRLCTSLAGKPKIFIFQACRGTQLDAGQDVSNAQCDADPYATKQEVRIPLEADFLYAYSTVPGYFSWRNSAKGSWFVQALCLKMDELASSDLDLVRILTRVSHKVAYDFESNASQQHMNRKKQIPSIVSMLTKDLYLRPK